MKKFISGIIIVLLLTITTGCSRTTIFGKWEAIGVSPSVIYVFNKDGTCSYETFGIRLKCTYKDKGDKLEVLYNGKEEADIYEYVIEDSILTIKDASGISIKYE